MDALAAMQLSDEVEDEEDEFVDCATWSNDEDDGYLEVRAI
jgi:hypothetical protein